LKVEYGNRPARSKKKGKKEKKKDPGTNLARTFGGRVNMTGQKWVTSGGRRLTGDFNDKTKASWVLEDCFVWGGNTQKSVIPWYRPGS